MTRKDLVPCTLAVALLVTATAPAARAKGPVEGLKNRVRYALWLRSAGRPGARLTERYLVPDGKGGRVAPFGMREQSAKELAIIRITRGKSLGGVPLSRGEKRALSRLATRTEVEIAQLIDRPSAWLLDGARHVAQHRGKTVEQVLGVGLEGALTSERNPYFIPRFRELIEAYDTPTVRQAIEHERRIALALGETVGSAEAIARGRQGAIVTRVLQRLERDSAALDQGKPARLSLRGAEWTGDTWQRLTAIQKEIGDEAHLAGSFEYDARLMLKQADTLGIRTAEMNRLYRLIEQRRERYTASAYEHQGAIQGFNEGQLQRLWDAGIKFP